MADERPQSNSPASAAQKDPHGQTQNGIEALKRRLHERIGAWLTGHWTQLLSAIGGIFVGAAAVYGVFSSQVSDAKQAASEAKQAATALTASVGQLQGTVNQLVTQQQLSAALERIRAIEEDYRVAHEHAGDAPAPRRRKSDGKQTKPPGRGH